jgi:hypothetical protein
MNTFINLTGVVRLRTSDVDLSRSIVASIIIDKYTSIEHEKHKYNANKNNSGLNIVRVYELSGNIDGEFVKRLSTAS